jgi:hypothetical protein
MGRAYQKLIRRKGKTFQEMTRLDKNTKAFQNWLIQPDA